MSQFFTSSLQSDLAMAPRNSVASFLVFLLLIMLGSSVSESLQASGEKENLSDPSFGRLFTTPEQRASLDRLRRQGGLQVTKISSNNENEIPAAEQATARPHQEIKLAGILWRADGKHRVWLTGTGRVNNRNILGDALASANLKVPLQGTDSGAILKPGQVWLSENHRVEEAYRFSVPKPVAAPIAETKVTSSTRTSEVQSSAQSSQK
jgi:hypothetical protein